MNDLVEMTWQFACWFRGVTSGEPSGILVPLPELRVRGCGGDGTPVPARLMGGPFGQLGPGRGRKALNCQDLGLPGESPPHYGGSRAICLCSWQGLQSSLSLFPHPYSEGGLRCGRSLAWCRIQMFDFFSLFPVLKCFYPQRGDLLYSEGWSLWKAATQSDRGRSHLQAGQGEKGCWAQLAGGPPSSCRAGALALSGR